MAFKFTAVGSKEEATAQLRDIANGLVEVGNDRMAQRVAYLLADELGKHPDFEHTGYEYRYMVQAEGNGNATMGPTELRAVIQNYWIHPAKLVVKPVDSEGRVIEIPLMPEQQDG